MSFKILEVDPIPFTVGPNHKHFYDGRTLHYWFKRHGMRKPKVEKYDFYLTSKQVAQRYGLSERTLRWHREKNKGGCPGYLIVDSRCRYSLKECDEFYKDKTEKFNDFDIDYEVNGYIYQEYKTKGVAAFERGQKGSRRPFSEITITIGGT
jgi:hypothetical protein